VSCHFVVFALFMFDQRIDERDETVSVSATTTGLTGRDQICRRCIVVVVVVVEYRL